MPGNIVAELDRQRELGLAGSGAGRKAERRIADGAALDVAGADEAAGGPSAVAADDRHGQGIGAADRRLHDDEIGGGVGVGGDRYAGLPEEIGEGVRAVAAEAIREPGDAAKGVGLGGGGKRRQQAAIVGGVGSRRQRVEALLDGSRIGRRKRLAGAVGGRDERHRAAGVGGQPVDAAGRLDRSLPVRRRGPAIVDGDEERARAGCRLGRRPVDRPGERDDQRRAEKQPEEKQPPGGPRRLLLLARDLEQEPRRRQHLQARPRRKNPHQPPDRRQRQQGEKHRRIGEGEGQAAHAARPPMWPAAEGPAVGEAGVERQQRLRCRPVGAVDEERPVEPAAEQGEPFAQRRQAVVVFLAILLGASDDMADPGFGIAELGAAGEGEGLFDRIEDLDEMRPGARAHDPVENRLRCRQSGRGSRRSARHR